MFTHRALLARLLFIGAAVSLGMICSSPLQAVVNQVDGIVVPVQFDCPNVDDGCIQSGLNVGEGQAFDTTSPLVDATLDANTGPETFLVPSLAGQFVTVTFELILEGAGFENIFGWYNVDDPTTRYPALYSCANSNRDDYEPGQPGATASIDFQAEFVAGRYKGGQVGFYLVTPEGSDNQDNSSGDPWEACATDPYDGGTIASGGTQIDDDSRDDGGSPDDFGGYGRVYYTETSLNNDGNYVHYLVYRSVANPQAFYFGFEDLFRGGDNDYDDTFVKVTGLVPTCEPSQEVCNGVDDNCNGSIDENVFRPCSTACGTGQEQCLNFTNDGNDANDWANCTATKPVAETCNGIDDDCNGFTDEGLTGSVCVANGCAGTNVCQGVAGWVCDAPTPTAETCDGLDNDCNGRVDDDGTPLGKITRSCTSICGTGLETCDLGTWKNCTAPSPSQEICDGVDNDCDGLTDEDIPEVGTVCSNAQGCSGKRICDDVNGLVCDAPLPQPETCDGVDNDCNGWVDDDGTPLGKITRSCTSICGTGLETCDLGTWKNCTAPSPSQEICDGIDNDCNGLIDDDVVDAVGSDCIADKCLGELVCRGVLGLVCDAPVPQKEICDGLDNDCNGDIDDDTSNPGGAITRSCTTVCGSGIETCNFSPDGNAANDWNNCTAPVPGVEICDGVDNDCNGQTDDGLSLGTTCISADTKCPGVPVCTGVGGVVCNAPAEQVEICDGKDNDCDGSFDEDVTRPCSTACGIGVEVCRFTPNDGDTSNDWGECSAKKPVAEICDGVDNNCNGQIDEGIAGLGTECQASNDCLGIRVCRGASGIVCDAPAPQKEICDGKDNDCNGAIDDNVQRPCATACGVGQETCVNYSDDGDPSNDWTSCTAKKPATETCNGLDDDCDGKIDNNLPPGKQCNIGGCLGKEICTGGKWLCNAPIPGEEICDGLDNNCNGQIDEGLNRVCRTDCGTGQEICQFTDDNDDTNNWGGCTAKTPDVEVCDGVDNDCNGVVDNDVPGEGEACDHPSGNTCTQGKTQCVGGTIICVGATNGSAEICDCKDNNCDGNIDEGNPCGAGTACVECGCRIECAGNEFGCPKGFFCTNGYCLPDKCVGIKCAAGSFCRDGVCVNPCDGVACDDGEVCQLGTCVKDNCYGKGCPFGQVCVDNVCSAHPCNGVACATGEYCSDGQCKKSCGRVACGEQGLCEDGRCLPNNPCAGVSCGPGIRCIDGACDTACSAVDCGNDRICRLGSCVDDPCAKVKCFGGEECVNGQCVTPFTYSGQLTDILVSGGGGFTCAIGTEAEWPPPLLWVMLALITFFRLQRGGRR